jgi:hypothetical protein
MMQKLKKLLGGLFGRGILGFIIILIIYFLKYITIFEGFQLLITYTLVIVTAEYAKAASKQASANIKMAEEMELTRKLQNKPSLIAYFDNPRSTLLDLVVKNIGYGIAKDVVLKISPPLLDHNNRDISKLSLFKQGISFFPPNREFRQIIGFTTQYFNKDSNRPLEYDLTLSYRDIDGNQIPDHIVRLDLSVYRDLPIHRESDIEKLTKEIANLASKIKG